MRVETMKFLFMIVVLGFILVAYFGSGFKDTGRQFTPERKLELLENNQNYQLTFVNRVVQSYM